MLADINVVNIYVSITGSLLPQINICGCRENIQNSTPVHSDFNDILIVTYKREIFPTFMLSGGVYITHPLN